MTKLTFASGVLALVFSAGMASASSITIGLGCGPSVNGVNVPCNTAPSGHDREEEFDDLPTLFNAGNGGLTVTVTGGYIDEGFKAPGDPGEVTELSGLTTEGVKVGRYGGGAGVNNSANDNHRVDAINGLSGGREDFLKLSFNKAVQITDLGFGSFNAGSGFNLIADSDLSGGLSEGDLASAGIIVDSSVPITTMFPDFYKHWFVIALPLQHVNSKFKVNSVTAHPVPLPAAGWMLLAGVGGVVAMKRRAKKKS